MSPCHAVAGESSGGMSLGAQIHCSYPVSCCEETPKQGDREGILKDIEVFLFKYSSTVSSQHRGRRLGPGFLSTRTQKRWLTWWDAAKTGGICFSTSCIQRASTLGQLRPDTTKGRVGGQELKQEKLRRQICQHRGIQESAKHAGNAVLPPPVYPSRQAQKRCLERNDSEQNWELPWSWQQLIINNDSAIEERGTNNRIMYTSLMYKYGKIRWDISCPSSRNNT